MKNIVFIVDGYYPNFSAVGVCIYNIIEELSEKYNVIIITKKNNNMQENIKFNGTDIRYINTIDNYIRNRISENLKTATGIKKKILQIEKIIVRVWGYIGAILKKRNVKRQEVKAFLKELKKINEKIDVIIPTCLPFESILAAVEFKSQCSYKVSVVPFLFDKFSKNSTLHRTDNNQIKKFKRHLLMEQKIISESDKIFFVESWSNHLNEYFNQYSKKFYQIEHPLLKKIISSELVDYNSEKINIIYTGALYKKIRSPLYALKLFSDIIEKDKRIVLHFYITGDCNSIVDNYCCRYPENIINHGNVSTNFAKSAIMNADILLSIGNSDITQIPSKIFEYISTGKPIIHFYYNKDDSVIKILEKYYNSYCVENDEKIIKKEKLKIEKMINFDKKEIAFNEVEKIFYEATPRFIANKIKEII